MQKTAKLCLLMLLLFAAFGNRTETADPHPDPAPVPAGTLTTGKVGLVAGTMNYRETPETWTSFLTTAHEAGAQVLSLQAGYWGGAYKKGYRWKSFETFFAALEASGLEFELSKDMSGPFFHQNRTTPDHLKDKPFTDPEFLGEYKKFLDAFLNRYGERLSYMLVHAEGAETYFDKHPDELDTYCEFLTEIRGHIHRKHSHIRVGVLLYPGTAEERLRRIGAAMDYTAYDLMKGKHLPDPSKLPALIEKLLGLTDGKIAIQNAGWSTSQTDDATEEDQVAFVREFYRVLALHRDRIEYASLGGMYDHDPAVVGPAYRAQFSYLPKKAVDRIIDSMCHFGFHRIDGSPKPGWAELKKQVRAYYDNP